MSEIRALCMSDLHLGADNSLLTWLDAAGKTDPLRTPPVLSALGDALRDLVSGQSTPPRLVLNGDVLEQALAPTNEAAMAFDRFVEALFPAGAEQRFSKDIAYLAGNHDHHQWAEARDALAARTILAAPVGQPIPRLPHSVAMRPDAAIDAAFVTGLLRRHPGMSDAAARMSYPDLGLRFDGGRRVVVFHHGHYIQSIYRLISTVRDLLFEHQPVPSTVDDIEAENGAWIDFFWSTLGRSGVAGRDVDRIYDALDDERSRAALAAALARSVARYTKESAVVDWVEEKVLKVAFTWLMSRAATASVGGRDLALDADEEEGLTWYLGGPLRAALETTGRPESLAFVFGHTHKPFSRVRSVAPWSRLVEQYNTGGWVCESESPIPIVGAAVVLVDDQGRVCSLRVYNETADGRPAAVRVESASGEPCPFQQAVAARVAASPTPWNRLAALIAADIPFRERVLKARDARTAAALR